MTRVKGYPRARIRTPFGLDLLVEATAGQIVTSRFVRGRVAPSAPHRVIPSADRVIPSADRVILSLSKDGAKLLLEARRQVEAYFAHKLARFDLPLAFDGTEFECDVWRCVADLGFGEFVSYADVARAIGRPFAHRGVARAIGRTEHALFVPAHRVVGSDGRPRGITPRSTRLRLIEFERSALATSGVVAHAEELRRAAR
jgi:O-6-methylguanine DNA methyltransferase